MFSEKKRLIIIDANAVIHRAYHALPPLTTKEGKLVNAVYGFLLVFFRAMREFSPDYVIAVFDFPAPSFRQQKYKLYKAKREKAPEDLYKQIPQVKEILEKFNVAIYEKEGFEADDIIGTISKKAPKKQIFPGLETIIISGDSDTLRLVDENTKVYLLKRGVKDIVIFDENKVKERYDGIEPERLTDFRALRGDPSDNIPGVPGIGEKTAIMLIKKFGSLENLYKEIEENTEKARELNESLREKLIKAKEQAFLSKMLAQIRFDVPIDFNLEKSQWGKYNREEVRDILEKYQFNTLLNRLPEIDNNLNINKKGES